MKATDLRIGNLVEAPNGYYYPVRDISQDIITLEGGVVNGNLNKQLIECLNPIPITLSILFSAKFKTVKENIYEWKWNKTVFRIERLAGAYWLKSSAGTTESKPLKYVHELQNLFHALHGEELTLKQ